MKQLASETTVDRKIANAKGIYRIHAVTASGEDLDNYTTEGMYHFNASNTPANIPIGVNGWLAVIPYDDQITKQLWFRHGTINSNDFQTFVRTKIGGVWGGWKSVLTSSSISHVRTNSSSVTIPANSGGSATVSVTIPTGYKAIGISGIHSNGDLVHCYTTNDVYGLNGTNTLTVWYHNYNNHSATVTFTVDLITCLI